MSGRFEFELGAHRDFAPGYAQEIPQKLEKLRKILEDPRTETESIEETRKRANRTMQLIEASINILLKVRDVSSPIVFYHDSVHRDSTSSQRI